MGLKNRNLNIADYLFELQREYFECEIRAKIYHKQKDKAYYRRCQEGKKTIIDNIAFKNKLPTIFNDKDTELKFINLVYPSEIGGMAHFKNETEDDIINYYSINNPCRVEKQTGIIKHIDFKKKIVSVYFKDDSIKEYSFSQVARIL